MSATRSLRHLVAGLLGSTTGFLAGRVLHHRPPEGPPPRPPAVVQPTGTPIRPTAGGTTAQTGSPVAVRSSDPPPPSPKGAPPSADPARALLEVHDRHAAQWDAAIDRITTELDLPPPVWVDCTPPACVAAWPDPRHASSPGDDGVTRAGLGRLIAISTALQDATGVRTGIGRIPIDDSRPIVAWETVDDAASLVPLLRAVHTAAEFAAETSQPADTGAP